MDPYAVLAAVIMVSLGAVGVTAVHVSGAYWFEPARPDVPPGDGNQTIQTVPPASLTIGGPGGI